MGGEQVFEDWTASIKWWTLAQRAASFRAEDAKAGEKMEKNGRTGRLETCRIHRYIQTHDVINDLKTKQVSSVRTQQSS